MTEQPVFRILAQLAESVLMDQPNKIELARDAAVFVHQETENGGILDSRYLAGYIDGRIAAENEFAERFGLILAPKNEKK